MAKVTGLGGLFYKVADVEKTRAWYQDNLGVGGEWGAMFPFAAAPDGFSLLSPFKADSDYFAPSAAGFMLNLRVDDLDSCHGWRPEESPCSAGRRRTMAASPGSLIATD